MFLSLPSFIEQKQAMMFTADTLQEGQLELNTNTGQWQKNTKDRNNFMNHLTFTYSSVLQTGTSCSAFHIEITGLCFKRKKKVKANVSFTRSIYITALTFGGTFFHYCSYVLITFNLVLSPYFSSTDI